MPLRDILKRASLALALGIAVSLPCGTISARAQEAVNQGPKPFLHPLFSENAVLQRDRKVPVWGWTQPQTHVTVDLDGKKQTALADGDGRWTVSLPPHAVGGPHTLMITGEGAGEFVTRTNLLFGDVWLCSGQSNMAYDLHGANNPEAEIAAANYPNIRLLQVGGTIAAAPMQSFQNATWKVCSPQTVEKFSAVGYFFGRKLNQDLNVPIGLIDDSWSGTPGESWVSGPALGKMSDFKPAVDALAASAANPGTPAEQMLKWWQNDPGTIEHQEAPAFDDSTWTKISVPGYWEGKGFPNFDGVMWLRRNVDVPAAWAGHDLQINLGAIDDTDTTYWNGAQVGATDDHQRARRYTVPGAQAKAGANVIAVRVLDTGGDGGFAGPAPEMKSGTETLPLDGNWNAHAGPALTTLPARPQLLNDPNAPVVLFNGKISPILPGAIKGVVWYQGESNSDTHAEAKQYRSILPILIADWRAHFDAKLPFYIVQLANFKAQDDVPSDDPWPLTREDQLLASQQPDTALVVGIDLGEVNNVHFKNKQETGRRLALSVENNTYGMKVEATGPVFRSSKVVADSIQLRFDHADGLNIKGEESRVFAIAGADKKFYWATPTVAGNVVTLRSTDVPKPVYARFGWSNNPRASLYNSAGLPASPFRTDTGVD